MKRRKKIKERILKIVLIICFSLILLFLASCSTFSSRNKHYVLPKKPKLEKVNFVDAPNNGFYLTEESATNLANNVDELNAYIKKLETLVKRLKKQ